MNTISDETVNAIRACMGEDVDSLAKAIHVVRSVPATADDLFSPEVIEAMAVVQKENPGEFARFKERMRSAKMPMQEINNAIRQRRPTLSLAKKPSAAEGATLPLQIPSGWIVNDSGIIFQEFHGDEPRAFRASYTPIYITKRVVNVDTDIEKLQLEWAGKKLTIPCSQALDKGKILQWADRGLDVSSESARFLVKYLHELEGLNRKIIPKTLAVSRMGWRGNDVFFPGVSGEYELDVDDEAVASTLAGYHQEGDPAEWLGIAMEARKNVTARFILAAAFGGPLLPILGQRTAIIHNWGSSGDGKTAALYLALSAWGDPEQLRLSFDSTKTGLERVANNYNHLVMGINERETIRDKGRDPMTALLYTLAEGKGRTRGTRSGLQATSSWLLYILTNGEDSIAEDAATTGARNRVLEINGGPFPRKDAFCKEIYRVTQEHYGWAGPEFIKKIISEGRDALKKEFVKINELLQKEFPENLGPHIDTVSVIAIADYCISRWLFSTDKSTAIRETLNMAREILSKLTTKAEASDTQKAWNFLNDWINSNMEKFGSCTLESFGFKDSQYLCVNPTVFNDTLRDRGYSAGRLLQEMHEKERILTTMEGGKVRYTVKRSNPYDRDAPRQRMIAIRLNSLGQ